MGRNGHKNTGKVLLIGSATRKVIRQWTGSDAGDYFGFSVKEIASSEKDGTSRIAIGAPVFAHAGTQSGYVLIAKLDEGSTGTRVDGPPEKFMFGYALATCADQNGDGADEPVLPGPYWSGRSSHVIDGLVVDPLSGVVLKTVIWDQGRYQPFDRSELTHARGGHER